MAGEDEVLSSQRFSATRKSVAVGALRVTVGDGAVVPSYGSDGAAGLDLSAPLSFKSICIDPGERAFVDTGVAMAIPPGCWGHVLGRSGLARKHGVAVLGGVIDCDYRGTIGVTLLNTGDEPLWIEPGQRVAQIVVMPYVKVLPVAVDELDPTARGAAGFGSTGK